MLYSRLRTTMPLHTRLESDCDEMPLTTSTDQFAYIKSLNLVIADDELNLADWTENIKFTDLFWMNLVATNFESLNLFMQRDLDEGFKSCSRIFISAGANWGGPEILKLKSYFKQKEQMRGLNY